MLKLKRQFSLLSLLVLVVQLFAQGPNGSGTYYRNANGQKGKSLKTALFQIISTHKDIGYKGLYDCYKKTDKRADGKVWDMYSNTTNYSFSDNNGGYKKEGDMYNREHSLPQSWFKEASPMKADIVHVVPTDGYVNNRRSSWPFGETNPRTRRTMASARLAHRRWKDTLAPCLSQTMNTRATSRAFISTWPPATRTG